MNSALWNRSIEGFGKCHLNFKSFVPLNGTLIWESQVAANFLLAMGSIFGVVTNCIVVYILGSKSKKTPLIVLLNGLALSNTIACVHKLIASTLHFFLVNFLLSSDAQINLIRAIWNFKMLSVPTHLIGK